MAKKYSIPFVIDRMRAIERCYSYYVSTFSMSHTKSKISLPAEGQFMKEREKLKNDWNEDYDDDDDE